MQFANLKVKVENKLLERAMEDWKNFIEHDGSIYIDEESVTETAFDLVYEGSEADRNTALESVMEALADVYEEMMLIVTEQAADAREWYTAQRSPDAMLRHVGMSLADFA